MFKFSVSVKLKNQQKTDTKGKKGHQYCFIKIRKNISYSCRHPLLRPGPWNCQMRLAPPAVSVQGEIKGGSSICIDIQGLGSENEQKPMPEADENLSSLHFMSQSWIQVDF